MNSSDFIPNRDSDFNVWAHAFLTSVEAEPTEYGLTAADITTLQTTVAEWDTSYNEMHQKRDAAKGATVGKMESRSLLEELLRNYARQIQADPKVSDELKADAGLKVHSSSRTPVPDPTTAPVISIDAGTIQQHFLRFTDSISPNSLSRPRGVFGVVIFYHIGTTAPVDDEQFVLHSTATRMKATINFSNADGGKTAWYRTRYINTRGVLGPWSAVYSSTIMK